MYILFILVYFGLFWFILVYFGLFWFILVYFGLFCYLLKQSSTNFLLALNDFRPPVGLSAPAKIVYISSFPCTHIIFTLLTHTNTKQEIAAPTVVEEPPPAEPEPVAAPEVKGLDLSIPNYPDPQLDTIKKGNLFAS